MKLSLRLNYNGAVTDLKRRVRRSKEEAKAIINKYTNATKRDAKIKAQTFADSGHLMRNINSRIALNGMSGTIRSVAEYSPHKEYGHMVYKGQLFPLKEGTRIVGWRRVTETRFIEGKFFMRDAFEAHVPNFIEDMTSKTLSNLGAGR